MKRNKRQLAEDKKAIKKLLWKLNWKSRWPRWTQVAGVVYASPNCFYFRNEEPQYLTFRTYLNETADSIKWNPTLTQLSEELELGRKASTDISFVNVGRIT